LEIACKSFEIREVLDYFFALKTIKTSPKEAAEKARQKRHLDLFVTVVFAA